MTRSYLGNTKGGSITVPLTSCFTSSDQPVLQIKTKIVSCHTANSKPVKQEVNGTVILPPLVFPVLSIVSLIQEKSPKRHLHERLFAAFASKKFHQSNRRSTVQDTSTFITPCPIYCLPCPGNKVKRCYSNNGWKFFRQKRSKKSLV